MKTGIEIYKELKELKEELRQVNKAVVAVRSAVGMGSNPDKHLGELADSIHRKLDELENEVYMVPTPATAILDEKETHSIYDDGPL